MRITGKAIRDAVIFLSGLYGFYHELDAQVIREPILILCAAMMGLPAIIRADEKKNGGESSESSSSSKAPQHRK